jgi:hypothetical protein
MPSTRLRSAGLAAVAVFGLSVPLRSADIDPSAPESAIMPAVKAIHDNDFKALFASFSAADQAKAEADWKKAQADPNAAKNDAQVDQFLGQMLDPAAVDNLMAQAEPQLKTMDLAKAQQGLMALSGMLPLMMSQNGKPMTADDQKSMAMVQSLLNDIAAWIPKSGVNDPAKLRTALEHVVAGVKALGVKDGKELRALSLDDLLGRLGPALKEVKAGFASYDLQADKLLESIKPTSTGDGDNRVLNVAFNAFGRDYTVPLKVQKVDGKWVLAKDAAPAGFDAFKGMLPGLPGSGAGPGDGQGEGGGEVK